MTCELVKIADCVTKVKMWNPNIEASDSVITYIDIAAVDKDLKQIIQPNILLGADTPSRARQIIQTDDVLVSTVRPNLNSVALVSNEYSGSTASTGYTVLRPNPEILDSHYLFHWVKNKSFIDEMVRLATGQSYPAVSDKIIGNSKIPLPRLEEQRRIAAILDKADELRQKRQQAIEKLDELLQAAFIDMFGDITEYQRSTLKLKDVAEINPKQSIDNIPNSVAFLPMADVHIDELFAINSSERSYDDVKKGFTAFNKEDILIAKITPCFENGKISIADISTQYGFGSTEFHVVRVKQKLYLYAIATLLRQSWIRVAGENVMTGSGGQKRIPKSYIENLSIPLMPDQNVEKFNEVFNKILQLKKVNLAQKASMDELFQSLQNQAFHGTL